MTKNDIRELLGGFGCFTVILIILFILLLVFPIVAFIGATITGGLIWLGWNLALVPIFGLNAITMWWQAWGLGLLANVVFWGIKSVVKVTKKED